MGRRFEVRTIVRTGLALVLLGCLVVLAAGCTSTTTSSPSQKANMASQTSATTPSAPKKMTCGACITMKAGKEIPLHAGEVAMENGVQVLRIDLKDHFYVPNDFTVKAGVPVKAVFSGSSADCLSHPFFSTLDKKGDLKSGTATIDLGALAPGTYPLACGMGNPAGRVVAQ